MNCRISQVTSARIERVRSATCSQAPGKCLVKIWWVHCEASAVALKDVSPNAFPDLGKHASKDWQIICRYSRLTSGRLKGCGARASLLGLKRMVYVLQRPGYCLAKPLQMRCRVSWHYHFHTLANSLQKPCSLLADSLARQAELASTLLDHCKHIASQLQFNCKMTWFSLSKPRLRWSRFLGKSDWFQNRGVWGWRVENALQLRCQLRLWS